MRKKVKITLIALTAIIILLLISWLVLRIEINHKNVERDDQKFSFDCDTTKIITETPSISLNNFSKNEIEELKFYILRKHRILKDTLIKPNMKADKISLDTRIPFESFKKTDTILLETKSKLYFKISDFHHYANLHYGMSGYLGNHDCRFYDRNYTVNGKKNNGYLLKVDALKKVNMLR